MEIRKTAAAAALIALALTACSNRGDSNGVRTAGGDSAASTPSTEEPRISPTTGAWMVDTTGAGPVRIGMTFAAADSAVPGGLARIANPNPVCEQTRPRDASVRGVALMLEKGRVVRVEVGPGARGVTREGLRIGDTEARVQMLYPAARSRPHKYGEPGRELILIPGAPADTLHRVVIGTDGRVVTWLRSGLYPAVEYVEGCL